MHIHFIGIGGIGVSALARYYFEKGHNVSGSDLVKSEITDALLKLGVKVYIGKNTAENFPKEIDAVIYSPAVSEKNLELKKAHLIQNTNHNVRILSYPEALGELTKQYFTIATSGTHGKSTTTAMIGLLMVKAGLDPTVIVGTKIKEFGDSNYWAGKSRYLIIEADEHFSSFLNYWPKIIVLTAVEADHLDYYKNLDNILKAFKKYIGHLPENGVLVANKDDKNIQKIIRDKVFLKDNVFLYSLGQNEAKKIKKILKVPGDHNVSNALAALTTARAIKISDAVSYKALSEYRGSWRRFEIMEPGLLEKGYFSGKIVISDYGHHPTEVKVTLKAAREKYPKKKIWCVFQPHQYQRTYYLFNDFVKVFRFTGGSLISKIIITDIYDVSGREEKNIKDKVSSEKLVKAINSVDVIYLPKGKILSYLKRSIREFNVLIIMGAGDIYQIIPIKAQNKVEN